MFVWDLMSRCHHLDLFASQQQYFGFPFDFQGQIRYFHFTFMMFGLSMSPNIFS